MMETRVRIKGYSGFFVCMILENDMVFRNKVCVIVKNLQAQI